MVTCLAVFEATSSVSRVSRKSAYEASLVVASWRRAFQALATLEQPQSLHLLVQALELRGAHADTAPAASVS